MKERIIKQMTEVVRDKMRQFQSDFEHDKEVLEDYDGAFLWLCAPSHTYLSLISPEHIAEKISTDNGLYAILQNRFTADYCFAQTYEEDIVFYYDGKSNCMEKITGAEARRIWQITKESAIFNYEQLHGDESVPTNFRVPVKVADGCGVKYLKEQLQFADSIGDKTLRNCLHRFQKWYKLNSTCRIVLYRDFCEHSFTFALLIGDGDKWKCVMNGGVIYQVIKGVGSWSINT